MEFVVLIAIFLSLWMNGTAFVVAAREHSMDKMMVSQVSSYLALPIVLLFIAAFDWSVFLAAASTEEVKRCSLVLAPLGVSGSHCKGQWSTVHTERATPRNVTKASIHALDTYAKMRHHH